MGANKAIAADSSPHRIYKSCFCGCIQEDNLEAQYFSIRNLKKYWKPVGNLQPLEICYPKSIRLEIPLIKISTFSVAFKRRPCLVDLDLDGLRIDGRFVTFGGEGL